MTMTMQGSVGAALREWRREAGLDQRSLAERMSEFIDFSYGTVDRYENNRNAKPAPMVVALWGYITGRKRSELPAEAQAFLTRIGKLEEMQCYLPSGQARRVA